MADDMGSTVPRRQLGRTLRDLRTEAAVTLDAAAEALECSRQKVWRIESGLGTVRGVDVRAMCELYGATRELTGALIGLAAETRVKGWWHAYGDAIPDWFEPYIGLEAAASRLRYFQESLIPGLLQTRGYILGVYEQRTDMSDDEREMLVAARLQRRSLLSRRLPPAPRIEVVLSEAALLRPVGGSPAMAEQLRFLLRATERPNISLRVLPLSVGLHLGAVAGDFVMLNFPIGNRTTPEPPVIYRESLTGALYLDRPAEIAAYEKVWANLLHLALSEGESRQLTSKIIEEIHHG